jgi:protein-disulfide isomerase
MEARKRLVLLTFASALFLFGMAAGYQALKKPTPLVVRRAGAITVGKPSAEIELVLIEDLQCRKCRAFSKNIIPKIQEVYVNTGKARLIVIPIAFLSGSQTLANAALEVYAQKPEILFPFLKETLALQGEIKKWDLVQIAEKMGGVDVAKLTDCIEKGCHRQVLSQNLNWARDLMGLQFRTPALYINGSPGSTFSFEAIQYQINQLKGKS